MSQDLKVQLRAFAEEILRHDEALEELETLRDKSRTLYEALVVACHQFSSFQEEASPIFEPSTEKIKDIVAQMTPQTQQMDELIEQITEGSPAEQEAMNHYQRAIEFEPISETNQLPTDVEGIAAKREKSKSLNDQLGHLSIGLNDRAVFIKHLFLGDREAFEGILTKIDNCQSITQAHRFLEETIIPKYNNWEGKESIAERFIHLMKQRFKD